MALIRGTHWEVRTTGSDTLCGGGLSSANANFATDLAATTATDASPVVTSASYSFVAGDVGCWLLILSTTTWNPGWYQIASVAAGAATLNAAAGAGVRADWGMASARGIRPTDYVGIASSASPTGGKWTIDYSQRDTAIASGSDLVVDATTNTKVTSAGRTFGKNDVGNMLQIVAGGAWTGGIYEIVSVASGAATLDRSPAATSSTGGTWYEGGAFATPGMASSVATASGAAGNTDTIHVRAAGTAADYVFTTSTANVSGGRVAPVSGVVIIGYSALRGDRLVRPTFTPGALTGITMFTGTQQAVAFINLEVDGLLNATIRGFDSSGTYSKAIDCVAKNCTNSGFYCGVCIRCYATGCTTTGGGFIGASTGHVVNCVARNNSVTGFKWVLMLTNCISANNTGGTSYGFDLPNAGSVATGCVAYANGSHGFYWVTAGMCWASGCVAVNNGGYGFFSNVPNFSFHTSHLAHYNNTSGNNFTGWTGSLHDNPIALSANPFVDAANGDFRLNDTPGGGALLRAASYPSVFPGLPLTANYADIGAVQASPSRQGWGL